MEQLRKKGFSEQALSCLDQVYRYALRLTQGREAEAEDLVQETFLLAYRSWDSFTPGTNCRAWLFTICRNAHLGGVRKASRRPTELSEADVPGTEGFAMRQAWEASDGNDPERDLFRNLVDAEVLRAVDELAEPFREVVVLSDLDGLSHAEIAEVLGLPRGTIKSRLSRGRRALHDSLHNYAVEMGYIRREGP